MEQTSLYNYRVLLNYKPASLAVRTGPSKLSKYCRFNEAVLNDEVTKPEVQKDLTEWVLSHDDVTVNPVGGA